MSILKKKIIFILILSMITITFSGCRFVDKETREAMTPITINYWRVFDGQDAFSDIIANYNSLHPHININYRMLRYDEYEDELLDAFSEDRGPDVFSIHNTWLPKYKSKLLPMPDETTLPYELREGTIKKETIIKLKTDPAISLDELKQLFPQVVYDDVVMNTIPEPGSNTGSRNRIFGLPLSIDTLVLYYNKDMLNEAGVVQAPATWDQFKDSVKAVTKIDKEGKLLQPGASFGTSDNVERYFDILSLLMLQNGADMIDDKGRVIFDQIPEGLEDREVSPAASALKFYTDYANPIKEVYTWDNEEGNALEEFINGNTAFFFGYAYHLPLINTQNPDLNYGISYMPQINLQAKKNYANYWVEVASKKTEYPDEVWDFIQFITKAENAPSYLSRTQKPIALLELVPEQSDDLTFGVFADQISTAQSWYKGYNIQAVEKIFKEMIDSVVKEGNTDYDAIILQAVQKVAQTLQP